MYASHYEKVYSYSQQQVTASEVVTSSVLSDRDLVT